MSHFAQLRRSPVALPRLAGHSHVPGMFLLSGGCPVCMAERESEQHNVLTPDRFFSIPVSGRAGLPRMRSWIVEFSPGSLRVELLVVHAPLAGIWRSKPAPLRAAAPSHRRSVFAFIMGRSCPLVTATGAGIEMPVKAIGILRCFPRAHPLAWTFFGLFLTGRCSFNDHRGPVRARTPMNASHAHPPPPRWPLRPRDEPRIA